MTTSPESPQQSFIIRTAGDINWDYMQPSLSNEYSEELAVARHNPLLETEFTVLSEIRASQQDAALANEAFQRNGVEVNAAHTSSLEEITDTAEQALLVAISRKQAELEALKQNLSEFKTFSAEQRQTSVTLGAVIKSHAENVRIPYTETIATLGNTLEGVISELHDAYNRQSEVAQKQQELKDPKLFALKAKKQAEANLRLLQPEYDIAEQRQEAKIRDARELHERDIEYEQRRWQEQGDYQALETAMASLESHGPTLHSLQVEVLPETAAARQKYMIASEAVREATEKFVTLSELKEQYDDLADDILLEIDELKIRAEDLSDVYQQFVTLHNSTVLAAESQYLREEEQQHAAQRRFDDAVSELLKMVSPVEIPSLREHIEEIKSQYDGVHEIIPAQSQLESLRALAHAVLNESGAEVSQEEPIEAHPDTDHPVSDKPVEDYVVPVTPIHVEALPNDSSEVLVSYLVNGAVKTVNVKQ